MGDSGLLAAIAQWLASVGIPILFGAWYRQWTKAHELEQRIAILESMELSKIQPLLTDIRIIVGELKVRVDYLAQGMQSHERNRRTSDQ